MLQVLGSGVKVQGRTLKLQDMKMQDMRMISLLTSISPTSGVTFERIDRPNS